MSFVTLSEIGHVQGQSQSWNTNYGPDWKEFDATNLVEGILVGA